MDVFDSQTTPVRSIKIGKDTKDVKNYYILKGGLDPNGKQIQNRYPEWSSVAKHGIRYQFVVDTNNWAKNLVDEDIKATYGADVSPDGFPKITSSSFTTTWYSKIGIEGSGAGTPISIITKSGVTITHNQQVTINTGTELGNRTAYVEVIQEEIRARLYNEGRLRARASANGKLKVDLTFPAGYKNWVLGGNVNTTIRELDNETRILRINEVQYSTTQDMFSLEQDIGNL